MSTRRWYYNFTALSSLKAASIFIFYNFFSLKEIINVTSAYSDESKLCLPKFPSHGIFFSVIAVVVLYHVFMCAGFFSTFPSLNSELMGQDVDSLSLYSKSLAYSRHLK